MLYLVVSVIAFLALIFVVTSDYRTGKHSRYYQVVQKSTIGKEYRKPNIPDATAHDEWFRKLNTL
ncbi:MAG: hypothetical protein ACYCVD_01945 [Desulfitobacteriaceae bacterium]